ncbi:hypothetical protein [Gordonia polyisoprenivorans]|uniref:hypothetical protein n=1 Tax=Gordonia polyisoprenivorans TaxID=84595 RepID=UPI002300CB44|nr:hypothetical protein [Gordonia polyisoprenivorans]WCB37537.1 hypothetical protein PHA63_26540 [Gordonia polyisoprenivorans]
MSYPDPRAQRSVFTAHPPHPAHAHGPRSFSYGPDAPTVITPAAPPVPGGYGQRSAMQAAGAVGVSPAVRIIAALIATTGALAVLAAFLPWVSGFVTVTGVGNSEVGATDGVITVVLGGIALVAGTVSALLGRRSALHLIVGIGALLLGAVTVLIAAADISGVGDLSALGITVGIGLWLTLLAGIVMSLAGVAAIVKRT